MNTMKTFLRKQKTVYHQVWCFITISRETTEEYTSRRRKTIPEGRSEKQREEREE